MSCLRANSLMVSMGCVIVLTSASLAQDEFGSFDPEAPAVRLESPPPDITLLSDFQYVDPDSRTWAVPAGYTANGASIPRAFWTLIGSPLSGKYRNASIVHDYFCDHKMHASSDEVHLMFYHACRRGGVGRVKASIMYWAVLKFGPQWAQESQTRIDDEGRETAYTVMVPLAVDEPNASVVEWAEKYFEENELTLEQIQALEPHAESVPDETSNGEAPPS